jgi:hypothetical protein
MAIYRRIESGGNGTFWKPKDPGSSIEGMFEGREAGEFGPLLLIRELDGVLWKVPIRVRLGRAAAQMQEGVMYKLTFMGSIAIGGGKTVKDFVVDEVVDDEKGEPEGSATADEPPF